MINKRFGLLAAVVLSLTVRCALAQQMTAAPDKATGVYQVGEKIQFKVELKGADDVKSVQYSLKKGGLTLLKDGTVELKQGTATVEAQLDEPTTLLAEFKAKVADKEVKTLAGAVAAPEQIKPSAPRPADFDAFWDGKIKELNAIPVNAKLESADSGKPDVEYFKVEMDNINGTKIFGQLAKPKKAGKRPAMLVVQWAGIYSLPRNNVVTPASRGFIALNIMAHELRFDQPKEYYDNASKTTHKDYLQIGIDSREKSYFLRMYLACYRAADYLANHPDWDGKTLVVTGTSQGGQQTFITAGLHPKITAMMANVPAGCDTTGVAAGRAIGFPYWQNFTKGRDEKAIMSTSQYFDCVNFAPRIKCSALVSLGLVDTTCPPAGVLAACNQTQGPKEIIILPSSDHQGKNNTQMPYFVRLEKWTAALSQSKLPPVEGGK